MKALFRFYYGALNFFLQIFRRLLFKNIKQFSSGTILLFRTGSIGDTICAFPVFAAVRMAYPTSKIYWLSNPAANNTTTHDLLDPELKIEPINYLGLGYKELVELLKSLHIDLFIELPQTQSSFVTNLRNLLVAKWVGASYGWGWQVYTRPILRKWQSKANDFLPESERLAALATYQGKLHVPMHFPIPRVTELSSKVQEALATLSAPNQKRVAFIIGSKRSTNQWPIPSFMEVLLWMQNSGYQVFVFGGPSEISLADPLIQLPGVVSLVGKTTILETSEWLRQMDIAISNDTGPMHLCYALDVKVVALFSQRDFPKHWYPPKAKIHKVLRSEPLPCTVCLLETCPIGNVCMKNITPTEVIKAIQELVT